MIRGVERGGRMSRRQWTKWIERYQRQAEERFQRLDAVLAELDEAGNPRPEQQRQQETTEGQAS